MHVSFSDAWLSIGCSACICKACLRQAFFFNKTRVGCPCPMSGSGLSSCILFWIRCVSLGLNWSHLDSDALAWIHYHVSFSGAWLSIGCSACIWKACLRQAFFFNKTRVGCPCPLSGSGLGSGRFTRIRLVSLGLNWSHLDSDALAWIHYHVCFSDASAFRIDMDMHMKPPIGNHCFCIYAYESAHWELLCFV
jgi:hypothetical protein